MINKIPDFHEMPRVGELWRFSGIESEEHNYLVLEDSKLYSNKLYSKEDSLDAKLSSLFRDNLDAKFRDTWEMTFYAFCLEDNRKEIYFIIDSTAKYWNRVA